ncbi:MAG: T9SS type A sorting domain-containing protein [bacterium]|nr:T9SS type A sorting domain-containing protein [bacterium]
MRITAKLNFDMEDGHDFLTLQYQANGAPVDLLMFTGTASGVVVDHSFTVPAREYGGTAVNEIRLRWRFTSDGSGSDEDCLRPSHGAAQIDLIGVQAVNGGIEFLDVLEDNESVENGWHSADCQIEPALEGAKWDDTNRNGIWDGDEPAIPNWEIRLYSGTTQVASTHTNVAGRYAFCSVPAGSYGIAEVQSPTMIQTYPRTVRHLIDYNGSLPLTGLDFGNTTCVPIMTCVDTCLGGRVDDFATADGDEPATVNPALDAVITSCSDGPRRFFDGDDANKCFGYTFADSCSPCWRSAVNGVVSGATLTIHLHAEPGSENDTFYFMEEGEFIWGVGIGTLRSLATGGGDSVWNNDDDGTFVLDLADLPDWCGVTSVLAALQDGDLGIFIQDDTAVDYVQLVIEVCSSEEVGSLHGMKYRDNICNGIQDGGDASVGNQEIRLYQNGALVQTTRTDAHGEYSFLNVAPGSYYVNESIGWNMVQSWPHTVSYRLDVEAFDVIEGLDFGNVYNQGPVNCTDSCLAGRLDGFATGDGPEPTAASAELVDFIEGRGFDPLLTFDTIPGDQWFAHTFSDTCSSCWQNACVSGAWLTIRMKAGSTSHNDSFYLLEDGVQIWGIGMGALQSVATGGSDTNWNTPDITTFHLNLESLPAWNGVTNVLAALQDGDLDMFVQDDTGVDYAELVIEYRQVSLWAVDVPAPNRPELWATVHPNPFNPRTQFEFELPVAAATNLSIFNAQGRRVVTLLDGQMPAGRKEVTWDGRDGSGRRLPAGVYIYRLQSGALGVTGKAILLK